MSAGVAEVQARIAEIQARFGLPQTVATRTGSADFASALAGASADYDAYGASPSPQNVTGKDVVHAATKYLGVPYLWGGTDPAVGLDCSALVQRTYGDLGYDLPRVSQDQATIGEAVPDLASAIPGDLLVFGEDRGHIGIYAGDGRMVVAPHAGAEVRIEDVKATPVAIRRVLGVVPPRSATGSSAYDPLFEAAGTRNGVSPDVLRAVARAESGLNPDAVSPAGAVGLMQLMPATAKGLGVDPRNPAQAVDGAARLLKGNLDRFGSLDQALAAYNAGSGAVARAGGVPNYSETQQYVRRILDELSSTRSTRAASNRTELP
jgi:cell wall-associated NlpC family hydrolase